jgi:RNase P subunit RPR2
MKILKEGKRPEDTVHRGTCNRCNTEFEFVRSEGTVTNDQRDGDFVSVDCPVCGSRVHSALSR